MFIGELFCLIAYFAKIRYTSNSRRSPFKLNFNPLLLAIPASLDIVASTMLMIALTQCAASVYAMLRGTIVIITAFLSVVFLKKKQYAHHWVSLMSILLGVGIVGYVGLHN